MPLLIQVVVRLLGVEVSYLRWDNYEYFNAIHVETLTQLFSGTFPHWNLHQYLGEPLHAGGQAATFYLPYYLVFALLRLFAIPDAHFLDLSYLLHLPIQALGWYYLTRLACRDAYRALLAAVMLTSLPFVQILSSVWAFSVPLFALLPWLLYCGFRVVNERQLFDVVCFTFLLACVAWLGHFQMLLYYWLFVLGALFVHAAAGKKWSGFGVSLYAFCLAALLALPTLLPAFELLSFTSRADPLHVIEMVEKGVSTRSLVGYLVPVMGGTNGFLGKTNWIMHGGSWFLLVPLLLFLNGGIRRQYIGAQQINFGLVGTLFATGLLFLLLSLADLGLMANLSGLPVIGAMRWPFKFLFLALPVLTWILIVLGAWGAGFGQLRLIRVSCAAASATIFLILIVSLNQGELDFGSHLWVMIFINVVMIPTVLINAPLAKLILVIAVFVNSATLVAISHKPDMLGLKNYAPSEYGKSVILDGRYLTLSSELDCRCQSAGPARVVNNLGIYSTATSSGNFNVTGLKTPLMPVWIGTLFPQVTRDVSGVVDRSFLRRLLDSEYLNILNIKFLIVARADVKVAAYLAGDPARFKLVGGDELVLIYENLKVGGGPLLSYDYEVVDDDLLANWVSGGRLAKGRGALSSEGVAQKSEGLQSDASNLVEFTVAPTEDALLIFDRLYYPGWRVFVDGAEKELLRVSGMLMGVEVPKGAQRVEFKYDARALRAGLVGALLGVLLLLVYGLWDHRRSRRRAAVSIG